MFEALRPPSSGLGLNVGLGLHGGVFMELSGIFPVLRQQYLS